MQRNEVILILEGLLKIDNKRKLHLSLNTRRFYNGFVTVYDDEDTLSFLDDKLGYITILYSQIINIEPMVEKWKTTK